MIGMSRHKLDVDNDQIAKDVLLRRDIKMKDEPTNTGYEDSFLPKTSAVDLLMKKIDNIVKSVNKHIVMKGEAWAHILAPGESTMYHTHSTFGPPGISFSYWVTYPKDSGEFIGVIQIDTMRHFHQVEPKVGDLLLFPTYLPHMTSRNASDETRISISGNYYPPTDKLREIEREPGTLFNYTGIMNQDVLNR
jgi:hypothetical protein